MMRCVQYRYLINLEVRDSLRSDMRVRSRGRGEGEQQRGCQP